MASGWVAPRLKSPYILVLFGGIVLVAAAINFSTTDHSFSMASWSVCIPFVIVFAMGIQNAFGRLYPKNVLAPTTIMTGNVTQVTLDFTKMLFWG